MHLNDEVYPWSFVAGNLEASGLRVQNSLNCRVNLLELHITIKASRGFYFYFYFIFMLTWAQD